MKNCGPSVEQAGFPDPQERQIVGADQFVITPREWGHEDSIAPTQPMRVFGPHGEVLELDDGSEPTYKGVSSNGRSWPYDPEEQRRRAYAAARAEARVETGRNFRNWGCGFLAGVLVITMGGFVLLGKVGGGTTGRPTGNVPGLTYTPNTGGTATAASTATTATTHPTSTNTPGSHPDTPTPGSKPTPQPTSPPSTPTTQPQPKSAEWGESNDAQTYGGQGTNPQGVLSGDQTNMYTCQANGYDQLQNPPQGDGPYVKASDVQLANGANSLPDCSTASASPAQVGAMGSTALVAWRPTA